MNASRGDADAGEEAAGSMGRRSGQAALILPETCTCTHIGSHLEMESKHEYHDRVLHAGRVKDEASASKQGTRKVLQGHRSKWSDLG